MASTDTGSGHEKDDVQPVRRPLRHSLIHLVNASILLSAICGLFFTGGYFVHIGVKEMAYDHAGCTNLATMCPASFNMTNHVEQQRRCAKLAVVLQVVEVFIGFSMIGIIMFSVVIAFRHRMLVWRFSRFGANLLRFTFVGRMKSRDL